MILTDADFLDMNLTQVGRKKNRRQATDVRYPLYNV